MNDSNNECPLCGEGVLRIQLGKHAVEYKGHGAELDLHFSTCQTCGSEQSDAVQLRANKSAMVSFRKQVDGLLSGGEVRELRERLGITQAQAAQIFGGGPVAFSKYENNDVTQSVAMDKLMRLTSSLPAAFDLLVQKSDAGWLGARQDWQLAADWIVQPLAVPETQRTKLRVVSSSPPIDGAQARYADAA